VEIVVCPTYDFLLSLHVSLASPDYDYADYDVGRAWIERARLRCNERDPKALDLLGHYFGDGRQTLRAFLPGSANSPPNNSRKCCWIRRASAPIGPIL
jgi:hypothetical protein